MSVALRCALLGALVGLPSVAATAPPYGQQELFELGNQRYQEGDWVGAIESYESVLSRGFESAELQYNLGNARFKRGDLGRAILEWERAYALEPSDPDVAANLELARSLTTDVVEPLPTFWLFAATSWWVQLLPRGLLIASVALGWLAMAGGAIAAILGRGVEMRRWGGRFAMGAAIAVLLLGTNLAARELGIGRAERGVILAESVSVRSAPADDDNLTLFEVHEGTRVRIDQRTGGWAEIVLDDGKVGWVPHDVMGII